MKKIKPSSVAALFLIVPFIMTYRISPGETPYWLFCIIFLLLLANLVIDLSGAFRKKYKDAILWILILLTVGAGCYSAILVRHKTSPLYNIHDIVLQQESVIRYVLHGKNPYRENYFGTLLEEWNYSTTEINPALYHYVMMPWYHLFAIPFYVIASRTVGFFDGRMPLVFLYFVSLLLIYKLLNKHVELRRLFVYLVAFFPPMINYFMEGRADFYLYAFFLAALYYLQKNKYCLSGILMALAFATKQSIWPIFPFYVFYLWKKSAMSMSGTLRKIFPFSFVFFLVTSPFFFWDKQAFFTSTIAYLSGSTPQSYPISGYGWGMVLKEFGIITNAHGYYPFWIWQAIICLPVLGVLIFWMNKSPRIDRLILSYGFFTFVYWYFSRYFNNSHVGYLALIFLTAYFWQDSLSESPSCECAKKEK